MQFLVLLAALLFAVFQVQAAVVPTRDNVTPHTKLATAGVQRFQSPFVPTSDQKLLCARTGTASMTSNFAREADCKALSGTARNEPGYWDTSDWSADNNAHTIANYGTCYFRISVPSTPGGDGHIWVGNADVGNAVGQAVAGFANGGQIAVMGQLTCSDPNGEITVNYSISD
ncbi:hypothetical protein PG989_007516 [Apiospora arundinis]